MAQEFHWKRDLHIPGMLANTEGGLRYLVKSDILTIQEHSLIRAALINIKTMRRLYRANRKTAAKLFKGRSKDA